MNFWLGVLTGAVLIVSILGLWKLCETKPEPGSEYDDEAY